MPGIYPAVMRQGVPLQAGQPKKQSAKERGIKMKNEWEKLIEKNIGLEGVKSNEILES